MPQVILISLTCHMLTNDDTEAIYSWPGTRFRSGEKVWVKQKNKNEKKGGQAQRAERLTREGKGPLFPSPDSSSVRFARPTFFSLFPHYRACSHFHSTTQHDAVSYPTSGSKPYIRFVAAEYMPFPFTYNWDLQIRRRRQQ